MYIYIWLRDKRKKNQNVTWEFVSYLLEDLRYPGDTYQSNFNAKISEVAALLGSLAVTRNPSSAVSSKASIGRQE